MKPDETQNDSYTVTEHPRGIVVTGKIPVTDFVALVPGWEARGHDVAFADIAAHLGAAIVLASKEEGQRWKQELERREQP